MVSDSTKITVLLAEYNALRDEVLAARNYMLVTFNILITATLTLLGLFLSNTLQFGALNYMIIESLLVLFFSITLLWNNYNTRKFTKRIREIECDINRLSGDILLIWETRYGWGDMCQIHNKQYTGFDESKEQDNLFKLNEIFINNIIHLALFILFLFGLFWSIVQKLFNWNYDTGQYGNLPHGVSAFFLSLSMTTAIMLAPFLYGKLTNKNHITKAHWIACIALIFVNSLTSLILYGIQNFPGTVNLILPLYMVLNKSVSYSNSTLLLRQTANELTNAFLNVGFSVMIYLSVMKISLKKINLSNIDIALCTSICVLITFLPIELFIFLKYPESLINSTWINVRGIAASVSMSVSYAFMLSITSRFTRPPNRRRCLVC